MFPELPFGPVRRFPVHALFIAARIHCIASRWPEAGGDVTRGCIDDETPLLCENKRPSTYRGAWPVLHCCSDDWCNRDVIPTLPPWASLVEGDSLSLSLSLSSGCKRYSVCEFVFYCSTSTTKSTVLRRRSIYDRGHRQSATDPAIRLQAWLTHTMF